MKKRLVIFSVITATLAGVLAYVFSRFSLLPAPATPQMQSIQSLLKILFSIASVILVLILAMLVYSLVFFRRRAGQSREGLAIEGRPRLERTWTLVPLAIVIALGTYGGIVLNNMSGMGPPQSELEVKVLAFQWGWQFEYPDSGVKSFTLELPVDRRLVLHLQSRDVIHSFWVPEFGPKQDVVPGMITELDITPNQIGQYLLRCSELCGVGHTYMIAPVNVVSADDFASWIRDQQSKQQQQ